MFNQCIYADADVNVEDHQGRFHCLQLKDK